MGMFLRRGPGWKRTITLDGNFGGTLCSVTVNGVRYEEETTLDLLVGTVIEIMVDGENERSRNSCYIRINDVDVMKGAGTYHYIVDSNATINMRSSSNSSGYSYKACRITTS